MSETLPAPIILSIPELAALARDIAMQLNPLPVILTEHHISPEQYERIKEHDFFKRALETTALEWAAATSTEKRLKSEGALYLEKLMPQMAAKALEDDQDLNKIVETGKLFAKVAGIGEGKPVGSGEKFLIQINLGAAGAPAQVITKDVTPRAPSDRAEEVRSLIEGPPNTVDVRPQPEGDKPALPLQPLPPKT